MAYLDQMYSQSVPPGGGPTGLPRTQATPQSTASSPYKYNRSLTGTLAQSWDPNIMGDHANPGWEKGPMQNYYKPTEGVDYGPAPVPGAKPAFDNNGNFIGFGMPGSGGGGGSGLFGDFGSTRTLGTQWIVDPETGMLSDPYNMTSTPSVSGATKFMSYAMPIAMMAGLGAGAAGGAFSGGAAAGGAGAEAGAGAGGLLELGGGGAGFTGSTAATGGATSLSALPGAEIAGSGSFLDLLKEYGPKAYELVAGSPGKDGKGGSRGIIDLLAGYYSSQQNKDLSGNLKGMYSDQRGLQNPYNDLLRASYQDPNVFYNSNQWKGLESVYQNKIDRQAAKGGTIANPTDRERLLQNYAMQELEKFRGGLKDAVNAYDPTRLASIAEKGYNVEANANNPLWAGAGRAGTGGPGEGGFSTENYIKQISSTASTAEQIYNLISKWFR